jgi:hypothetical protein
MSAATARRRAPAAGGRRFGRGAARTALALTIAAAAGLLLSPRLAHGYACITTSCSGYCTKPVPYRLSKGSDDLGEPQSEVELKSAFEAWTKVSCTSLQTQYGGRTDEAPANGNGVVAWVEAGWSGGSGTIGTTTIRGGRGCINSHMRLNAVNFRWVSGRPANRGEVNTFSIVAHEAGHYFGLGHTSAAGAIMRASYAGGVLTIAADDEMGICRIYAGSGGGAVPAVDCREKGCPAGYTCVEATCRQNAAGDGGAGTGGGGGTGVDARPAPTPQPARDAGASSGGAPAGTARDAGAGTGSSPSAGSSPPPPPPPSAAGTRADGQPCDSNDDCRSDFCLVAEGQSVCSRLCRSNADCTSGFACRRAGAESVCVPLAFGGADGGAAAGQTAGRGVVTGGCAVARAGAGEAPGPIGLALAAAALARRRRRRP